MAPALTFVKYEASCGNRGPTLVINPMVRSVAIRERGGWRQLQGAMVTFGAPNILTEALSTLVEWYTDYSVKL